MNCLKCGSNIKPNQEVCLNCGHILGYESQKSISCNHCNRIIPVSYKKCPYCHKNQTKSMGKRKFAFILITILIDIACIFHVYNVENPLVFEDYIKECSSINYENLVRNYSKFNGSYVTYTGTIESVKEINSLVNRIEISIKVNDNIIKVRYNNVDNIGFMNNDSVTIYGRYNKLVGNIPLISARFIIKA